MRMDKLEEIVKLYGTPAYVFDVVELEHRVAMLRNRLPKHMKLCFAMKANPFLTGIIADMVDRLEVCSPGEYEICIRENVNPEKIVVSGVNKTTESMRHIFSYSRGAGIYTIESEQNYSVLKQCALESGRRIRVLLRLSSGNQFGMDRATLERIMSMVQEDDIVDIAGIHYYSGTQKQLKKIEKELRMLDSYAAELAERKGIRDMELEYGPGLAVSYFENDSKVEQENQDADEELTGLGGFLETVHSYQDICIELGRFLVTTCGCYMTRIMDIKQTDGTGYIIVDGGTHQIRYYGQMMGMKRPYIRLLHRNCKDGTNYICIKENIHEKWTVCGSLCTVNDVLVRDIALDAVCVGDVMVFDRCGAYSVTEGMALFLSRELPMVLLIYGDGQIRILREKKEIYTLNAEMEEK